MIVAVIPARGGSKRIPRKNVRQFAGKPMIAHSIEAARRSGLFERIVVSTDDAEIAQIAQEFQAEVPFMRPASLSDDYTGTTEVIAHAVEWLGQKHALFGVCCIYPTAPFIESADLAAGLRLMQTGQWRYVFAATEYAAPVHRAFIENAAGGLEMMFPEHFSTRSQDLPTVLHDAGQFYWGTPQAWLARATVFDRQSTVVKIPAWRVQDIDTEDDWLRAEALASHIGELDRGGNHT